MSCEAVTEAVSSPKYVQACVTALGFPNDLASLIRMADWHREECGRWITDLETLLSDEDKPGFWTAARWMTEGDILFFYQSGHRPRSSVRRHLKEARTLLALNGTPLLELLERNLELINRFGDTIFACAEVTQPSEYIPHEAGEGSRPHYRNRVYVEHHKVHVFRAPLGGDRLRQRVMISRRGSITPLLGKDFEGVKRALAEDNALPEYLLRSRPGGGGFGDIGETTWREISCSPERRFFNEAQIRVYFYSRRNFLPSPHDRVA